MLVYNSKLIGTPVLSVQTAGPIGYISSVVVDPNTLKTLAFYLSGPLIHGKENLLDVNSIREYSSLGLVIDDVEELIGPDDVVKISEVLKLNFNLIELKVETKRGTKLGKVVDFTMTSEDFIVRQIIVRQSFAKSLANPLKGLTDSELVVPRSEIVEVTDYKIIVKDEEKAIRARASKADFIPNYVNPFREPGFASSETADSKELEN